MIIKGSLFLIVFCAQSCFSPVFAQTRNYIWSDQYEAEDAGGFEIESYSDFNTPALAGNVHFLNQQFELEYGVSPHFTLGVVQTFGGGYPEGNWSFGVSGIEAMYRLMPPDRFVADPVLYAEYSRTWTHPAANQFEAKLILTRSFGRLSAIANAGAEYQFGAGSELEPEFSGGISYQLVDGLSCGLEMFATGSDDDRLPDADLRGTGAGPTVSVSTPWFDIASGLSYGITGGADRMNFRAIVTVDL